MIKGIYAAASAMLVNMNRQGTIAHNVANLDTPGFKDIMLPMEDYLYTGVAHPSGPMSGNQSQNWIGSLGLGVESLPEKIDFSGGAFRVTDQPLDFAIQGSGFFQIETPSGVRYTRDGRFDRDLDGNLVTIDGYFVLDNSGNRINLPEGDISFASDGTISVAGTAAGQIGLAAFTNPDTELVRDMPNMFSAPGGPTGDTPGFISQGALEMSNGNAANLMTQMVSVTRAYEAAQRMVQIQDDLLGRSIASLGNFNG